MRWAGTLKARLMLASALVIAASVAVSTMVVLQRVERRTEQAVMDLERDNVERIASLLAQRVVGLQKMLRASAGTLPPAARSDGEAAGAFLAANPALRVSFASVFVAAASGRLLALHDGNAVVHPPLDIGDRDYFKRTLERGVPQVSGPLAGRLSREPIIQLTMPVGGDEGETAAVIGGTLRLRSRNLFDDLTYAGSSDHEATVTIVTDSAGTIISHPRRERVLQPIASEPGLGRAVALWVAQGRPVEPSGMALHEQGVFAAMAGVPGADWLVFRVAPDAQLMGGLEQARREAMLWAAGVALLGGLLILALLALLLGPLTGLRQRALALHDNSRSADEGWPVAGGELGELSRVLQSVMRERAQGEQVQHKLVQQMGSVLAAAPIGIAFTRERRFELAGAEFCALLGRPPDELSGRLAVDIFAGASGQPGLAAQVQAAFRAGRPYFGELPFTRGDGSRFWGRLQGRPVAGDELGAGTIWLLEDVTEHRAARERLSWTANHDALTRLLNRGAFEEQLQCWIDGEDAAAANPGAAATTATAAVRDGSGAGSRWLAASLLMIDLDRFKEVNDNAGHAAGDRVLREVASALHGHVRAGDIVGRLGGDEFALLLPGCVGAVAVQLALRLRLHIERIGVEHGGRLLTVDASIGVVEIAAARAGSAAHWLALADAACYEAKRAGRGCVRRAEPRPLQVACA